MALDGAFLSLVKRELADALIGARIDKIFQPSRDEIVLVFRYKGGSQKVLFSANAGCPRVHFTNLSFENPQKPPMFCMLLRKRLNAAKLTAIRQNGMDRVLAFDFETVNELGDLTNMSLMMEVMGRHSNIILVDEQGKVVDSIKRVSDEVSSVRMVLPGVTYVLPPAQDKKNLLKTPREEIAKCLDASRAYEEPKAIMDVLSGISPLLSRELSYRALKGQEIERKNLSDYYKNRILDEIETLREILTSGKAEYTAVFDPTRKIREFTMMDITQYGKTESVTHMNSPSELLDNFYASRDRQDRMKQRSHDLLRLLLNATERITKKLALQKEELARSENREELKLRGDLLNANLYRIKKGDRCAVLENFYREDNPSVSITLDPRLTPAQNAQKYYAAYRKAATAEEKLRELMAESEKELVYLDSVFDAVSRTDGESELLEIREELAEQGYIRFSRQRNRALKPQPPLHYRSSDGFSILCGRNNKQNDKLTLKMAQKTDLWLHTKDIAGSHVIIETSGALVPEETLREAAMIAALHSKARESSQVAVDYTLVKNVKKPNGAKPGMVIFTDYKTLYVKPDAKRSEQLKEI